MPTAPHLSSSTSVEIAFGKLATPLVVEAANRALSITENASAESFHKLRIALRRLRTLWWAYEPLLDKRDTKLQRDEFKVLADAAGKTRDWDVLRELIVNQKRTRDRFGSMLPHIETFRSNALTYSRAAIGNANIAYILESAQGSALTNMASAGALPHFGDFARTRVEAAERKLRKQIQRAISAERDDYATLHEVRIACKKVRYILEFFSPVLDNAHQSAIQKLASIQKELGDLNDIVTSESLIRQYQFGPEIHDIVTDLKHWLVDEKRRLRDNAYAHIRAL